MATEAHEEVGETVLGVGVLRAARRLGVCLLMNGTRWRFRAA